MSEKLHVAAKANCAEGLVAKMLKEGKRYDEVFEEVAKGTRCPDASSWRYKNLNTFVVENPASGERKPVALVFTRNGAFG